MALLTVALTATVGHNAHADAACMCDPNDPNYQQCMEQCLASNCKDTCKAGTITGDSKPGTITGPCLDSSGACTKADPNGNYSCNGCSPTPVYDENDEITGCQVTCTGKSISPG